MIRALRSVALQLVVLGLALGVALAWPPIFVAGQAPRATGRALAIEDYYRIQTVGGVQFSPDSRWISFTASTRVEENQANRSEAYVVPADGSAAARRIQHEGRDVTGLGWTADNRIQFTANQQVWTIDPATPASAPVAGAPAAA